MMLMKRDVHGLEFVASCFLVKPSGYLLTTASGISSESELVAVTVDTAERYPPMSCQASSPIPVDIVALDRERDTALLRLQPDVRIQMPDDIIGEPDETPRGALLLSVGIPYGREHVHTVVGPASVLAGRTRTETGTNLLLFDHQIHPGDIGGPMVRASDGLVIGIVAGLFHPSVLHSPNASWVADQYAGLSYAVSIQYGSELLTSHSV